MTHTRKLIEVALPLDEINAACKADKDRKTGTIRNLHKWFAPMPLPAWRSLLYAALIDDPDDDERRAYHLDLIKRLVANGADLPDEDSLVEARANIARQFPNGVPPVLDPFCGGGSTLVEAQRLGLPVVGSDLNPVPTLISRMLVELLPRVRGGQALHGDAVASDTLFSRVGVNRGYGFGGIEQDVLFYADEVGKRAREALSAHYPSNGSATPFAWLWARTAPCPSPSCGQLTILATSWWLSEKSGDRWWLSPEVGSDGIVLTVKSGVGEASDSPKIGDGVFACVSCGAVLDGPYLRGLGSTGQLGLRMTAVAEIDNGRRTFREPNAEDIDASRVEIDRTPFRLPIVKGGQGIRVTLYGMDTWDFVWTDRQLATLQTFARLVSEVHGEVLADGGSKDWADAVTTLLALAVGKMAQFSTTQAIWRTKPNPKTEAALASHSVPMMWDFPEVNVFGDSVGDWRALVSTSCRAFRMLPSITTPAHVVMGDARSARASRPALIATDPPYFEAIGYADHSDFFYIWHRLALRAVQPDLYLTVAAPKGGELTAITAHHDGDANSAREYFIEGFTEAFKNLQESLDADLPLLVVYASKERKSGTGEETRWSSILTAMVNADLEITGTWPIRGTTEARMISAGTNAVAAYVVMVCRPRPTSAGTCSLADFNRALRRELKSAVRDLQAAGILPVDLAQAAMGPGMQIYSRYKEVVDQTGQRVPVEQALRLINSALGEVMDEQEGELDPDSRFAVAWWEKHGWEPAPFGEADQLARPQGISVDDVIRAGVATYPKAGFVCLVGNKEMNRDWLPSNDTRPTAWESVHHLADRLIEGGGVVEAGRLMRQLGLLRDPAQALVYRLHAIAARKGRAKDQERYNALIGSWSDCLAIAATEKDGLF